MGLQPNEDQQLFERGAHGMAPTAAGRLMYRLFLPIVHDLAHTRQQLDAALINKPRSRLSLDAQPLLDEEMVLVTSATHGPDLPHAIELAQLPELELVLPTTRHGLRGVPDTAAQHEDILLAPRFEIDVLSTIVKLVESTRFTTILPRIAVERAVRQGTLRAYPILAPSIVRHIKMQFAEYVVLD
jgi:LysR family nitrogen assimilation transcriptional regulator